MPNNLGIMAFWPRTYYCGNLLPFTLSQTLPNASSQVYLLRGIRDRWLKAQVAVKGWAKSGKNNKERLGWTKWKPRYTYIWKFRSMICSNTSHFHMRILPFIIIRDIHPIVSSRYEVYNKKITPQMMKLLQYSSYSAATPVSGHIYTCSIHAQLERCFMCARECRAVGQ